MSRRVFVLLSNFLDFARRDSLLDIQRTCILYYRIMWTASTIAAFTHITHALYAVESGKKLQRKNTRMGIGRYYCVYTLCTCPAGDLKN